MKKLLLLPGMDGTGRLFAPFLEAIGPVAEVQVVRYPGNGSSGYEGLVELARAALPTDGDFFILGESFSGPVAISLAAAHPPGLMGLILCCTFVRNPRPFFGGLQSLLGLVPAVRPPLALLNWALLGCFSTHERQTAFHAAMSEVSPLTLRSRLQAVLAVDVAAGLRSVDVPVLYLRASEDRLVPRTAARLMKQIKPDMRVVDIAAPHFLLQANPKAAAEAVAGFMGETRRASSRAP